MKEVRCVNITAIRGFMCSMTEMDCIEHISWLRNQYPMLFGWISHTIQPDYTAFGITLLHSAN